MSISKYIKEIGRGKAGARSLAREDAADLMGKVLDGVVTDLEVGAFCLAMRVKGESTAEMLGFLDAAHARMAAWQTQAPWVVLPSYNGARKLPVLTPLLAALLAREGLRVWVHGPSLDAARTTTAQVWAALGWPMLDLPVTMNSVATNPMNSVTKGQYFTKIDDLSPGLARLLAVRRVVGVRNSSHSLVKLMNPTGLAGSCIVGSYTHPEYLELMGAVFEQVDFKAMLLRGTEGEPVADARRCPQMDTFANGTRQTTQAAQTGPLAQLPDLPREIDADSIAKYTRSVLDGDLPVPQPIAIQVAQIAAHMSGSVVPNAVVP